MNSRCCRRDHSLFDVFGCGRLRCWRWRPLGWVAAELRSGGFIFVGTSGWRVRRGRVRRTAAMVAAAAPYSGFVRGARRGCGGGLLRLKSVASVLRRRKRDGCIRWCGGQSQSVGELVVSNGSAERAGYCGC